MILYCYRYTYDSRDLGWHHFSRSPTNTTISIFLWNYSQSGFQNNVFKNTRIYRRTRSYMVIFYIFHAVFWYIQTSPYPSWLGMWFGPLSTGFPTCPANTSWVMERENSMWDISHIYSYSRGDRVHSNYFNFSFWLHSKCAGEIATEVLPCNQHTNYKTQRNPVGSVQRRDCGGVQGFLVGDGKTKETAIFCVSPTVLVQGYLIILLPFLLTSLGAVLRILAECPTSSHPPS